MDLTLEVQIVEDGEQFAYTRGCRKIDALGVQSEAGAHLVLHRNVRGAGGILADKDNGKTWSQAMLLLQARDLSDSLGIDLLGDDLAVDEFPRHRKTITKPCRRVRWRSPDKFPPGASLRARGEDGVSLVTLPVWIRGFQK